VKRKFLDRGWREIFLEPRDMDLLGMISYFEETLGGANLVDKDV
jgi:hypothetical protein